MIIKLKHTSGSTAPTNLEYGELALNYLTGSEKLWLKNSDGTIKNISVIDAERSALDRLRIVNNCLRISGDTYSTGEITAYIASDRRLKMNIKPISGALDVINRLNPVVYNWNETAKRLNKSKGNELDSGVIAQELEQILPQNVHKMANGYKSVDYVKLIPYLIAALKEQQKEIDELKKSTKN